MSTMARHKVRSALTLSSWQEADEALRRGMKECVVYPEPKIDKEATKKYSPGEIAAVGAKLEVEDVFGYEVDEAALGES